MRRLLALQGTRDGCPFSWAKASAHSTYFFEVRGLLQLLQLLKLASLAHLCSGSSFEGGEGALPAVVRMDFKVRMSDQPGDFKPVT